jgi:hypothetical protein
MAKKKGLIGQTYHRLGSVTDNTLGIADETVISFRTGMQSLQPMAQELLNDSKAELTESIINLARVRKSAEVELIKLGYSDIEVAEMLAPTK